MVFQNDLEDRFGHLLQPIRDLAKLWDVDVASYLTDYLDELEKITITFDEGKTTMNFAEAALLIQGSTSVYSKKVENLYNLVYQVMDVITNKKGKNKKPGSENSVNEGGLDDEDEEFLSLDDIHVGKNITIREGDTTVLPVKLTPLSIIRVASTERDQNPLLSKTGEHLGSRDDFRMNTCYVHRSGAMLIDTSYISLLLESLQNTNDLAQHRERMPCETIAEVAESVDDVAVTAANEPPPSEDMSIGDDGAPPLLDPDDNEGNESTPPKPAEPEIRERLRSRKPIIEKIVERKPLSEVFVELDPYSVSDKPDKSIGKGKIIKTPVELREDDNSKKRKRKSPPEKPKVPISVFIQTSCFSHHGKYNKTAFNTPSFHNLENQFWKEYVRRKKIWAKEKKLLKSVNSKQLKELVKDREDEVPAYDEFGGDEDDGDDDANVDNLDEGAPAFNVSFGQEPVDMIHDFSMNRDELTSYEELARQHIERFMACGNYVQSSEIAQKVAEWEEKMLPRLEEEEKRPPFDIHLYGTQILDNVKEKNRIKFSEITVGKPDHEICRTFSALLQLVNGGNIMIHKSDNFLEAMDEFELELLSLTRHHEELANKQYES